MPSVEQILAGLKTVSNEWRLAAIGWHVYLAAAVLLLAFGLRPSRVLAGLLLALPLVSVSAAAWSVGNPFNGVVFAVLAVLLAVLALRLGPGRVAFGPAWLVVPGFLLLAFGWVYPHFLDTQSFVPYLYSAPVGVVPCPTLSAVIGLALVLGGLGSRAFALVLGIAGLLYGFIGVARLGVAIDAVLLAGAALLTVAGLVRRA